jgi:hypothetical protein
MLLLVLLVEAYTDLVLIVNETCSTGSVLNVQFNSDTGSNYSSTYMYGDGSVRRLADNQINLSELLAILVASTIGTTIVNFQNYSNTTTYKTYVSRTSTTGSVAGSYVLYGVLHRQLTLSNYILIVLLGHQVQPSHSTELRQNNGNTIHLSIQA